MPVPPAPGFRDYGEAAKMAFRRERRMRLGSPQVEPTQFVCGKTIRVHDAIRDHRGPLVEFETSDPCRLPVNHEGVCEPVLRDGLELAQRERDSAEQALAETTADLKALQGLIEVLAPEPDAEADAAAVLARLLVHGGVPGELALQLAVEGIDAIRPILRHDYIAAGPPSVQVATAAARRLLDIPVLPGDAFTRGGPQPLCGPPNGRNVPGSVFGTF